MSWHLKVSPVCIADNGNDGHDEVTLFDCPCAECTKLAYDAGDGEEPDPNLSLADYRRLWFPEYWS